MTVLGGTVVAVAAVVTFLLPASSGWRGAVVLAFPLAFLAAVAVLIVEDSAARGRSGWKWFAACALAAPLGLPAFAAVAVYDRLHGRPGIEARWGRAGRWWLLGGLILAVAAAGLAVSQVTVPSISVSAPGASGYYSGSCSSALSVLLGAGRYGNSYWPAAAPPILTSARSTVAHACSAAAAGRMLISAICLGGAMLLAFVGMGVNLHQRQQAPAHLHSDGIQARGSWDSLFSSPLYGSCSL